MAKLRVGWFSFSCCEDSSILMTELLNDHWEDWKDKIEFVHARILKSNNVLKDLDVSFVEGAIANKKDHDELLHIRKNSKKLVAIGSCACTGIPSGQRNQFDEGTKASIQYLLDRYGYEKEVVPLEKIVTVDAKVAGCPMVEAMFLKTLNGYLEEFGIVPKTAAPPTV